MALIVARPGRVNFAHDAAQDFSLDILFLTHYEILCALGALIAGFDPAQILKKPNEWTANE